MLFSVDELEITMLLTGQILHVFVIITCCIFKSNSQTIYSCDSNAACGCSMNSAVISRIVGGEMASPFTWSWAVSISIQGLYLCGGSIISSSWIITAAHCMYGRSASSVIVYAGSTSRWSGTQSRRVIQTILHAQFNPTTYVNDMALLKLETPFSMSDPNLRLICLPTVNQTILSESEWPSVGTSVCIFESSSDTLEH